MTVSLDSERSSTSRMRFCGMSKLAIVGRQTKPDGDGGSQVELFVGDSSSSSRSYVHGRGRKAILPAN